MMVKPISLSINEVLKRYDTKDQVAVVTSKLPPTNDDVAALIQRIDQLEVNQAKAKSRRRLPPNTRRQSADCCSHCIFLNKQQVFVSTTTVLTVERRMFQLI